MKKKESQVSKKEKKGKGHPSASLRYAKQDPRFSAFENDDFTSRATDNVDQIDGRFRGHLQDLHDHLHGMKEETSVSTNHPEETIQSDIEDYDDVSGLSHDEKEATISLTCRLALVDFELWECVVAQDLFVLFCSFVPHEGKLRSVAIYTSELGKQHQQGKLSPDLWSKAAHAKRSTDLDKKKVKQYKQFQRQFYYAILEFDSKQTATEVYDACNGAETEFSTHPLVIQAVPDAMEFSSSDTCDSCDVFPTNYTLPPILGTIASRINSRQSSLNKNTGGESTAKHESYEKYVEGQLVDDSDPASADEQGMEISGLADIWDVTDPKRTAALDAAFSATTDMAMNDLDAYVASDVDSTDESSNAQGQSIRQRYASLLDGLDANEEDGCSDVDENLSQKADSQSDDECGVMGDMSAEFVASNEKGREDLHRKVLQELELHNASSIAEKAKLKRKMNKKIRRQAAKLNRLDENVDEDESPETEVGDADSSECGSPAPKISAAKEKRKAHKLRKQMAAQDEREVRRKRRIEQSTGLRYADDIPSVRENESTKEISMVDDRFSSRLTSQKDYFLDPTLRKV